MDNGVGVGVGAGAAVEDEGGVVLLGLVGAVGDVGEDLAGDVLLCNPQRPHARVLHQRVFTNINRPLLIRPIHLINSMLIRQHQQHLII